MLLSSTVTVWAGNCGDECDMAGMPCCPGSTGSGDLDAEARLSQERTIFIRALGCCPARSTACTGAVRFDPGHAQAAHDRAAGVCRDAVHPDDDRDQARDRALAALVGDIGRSSIRSPASSPPFHRSVTPGDPATHLKTVILLL